MTIPQDVLIWLMGIVGGVIAVLLGMIWSLLNGKWILLTEEANKSANYRHHDAPKLFAEAHLRIHKVEEKVNQHEWRITDHDGRLSKVEGE